MRLATFNLESLDERPGAAVPLEDRIEILRPTLERLAADILCLQEVNGQKAPGRHGRAFHALDRLLSGTRYEGYERAFASPLGGQRISDVHNLVTLSRFPVAAGQEILHRLVPPLHYRPVTSLPPSGDAEPIRFDRPILRADISLPDGSTLIVLNLHLRAPIASPIAGQKQSAHVWRSIGGWAEGYFVSSLKRSAQALELRLEIEAIFDDDPHACLVACGDFNAEDREMPLRITIGAEEDTGNGRLAARSLVVLDRTIPGDRRFSVIHHGRPQMLDHILVSRQLLAHVQRVEAHNETLSDEIVGHARIANDPGSYHAPVLVELALG